MAYEFACDPNCFVFQQVAELNIDATPECTNQRQRMVSYMTAQGVSMGTDDLCGGVESVELQAQIDAARATRMEIQHAT